MNRNILVTAMVILLAGTNGLFAQEYDLLVSSRNTSSVKKYNGSTGAYIGDFITSGSGGLRHLRKSGLVRMAIFM